MGDIAERRETTDFASGKIKEILDRRDFTSAILLSSIYVEMRLRTLITLRLQPPEKKWKETSRQFINLLGYKKLLNVCSNVGLLKNKMDNCSIKKLKELYDERCNVAHETQIWKGIDETQQQQITDLCNNAIQFLKNTTD